MAEGLAHGPLTTLEALRRDAVDSLARKLRDARTEHARATTALAAAQAAQLASEQRLARGRAEFATAERVLTLQRLEGNLRALELACAERVGRARRAARAEQETHAAVNALAAAMLNAERDRRAAARVLEDKRVADARVKALSEEEEADEAFRARGR